VSQLVLLALQMKPMPMMVFCSLNARQNSQKYWTPLILLLRPWDYTHHGRKTKIQNIGHGTSPSSVYMQASGQTVEAVDQFLYLGSAINFDGRSTHEIHRRIDMASGVMCRLSNMWQQSRLRLATKLRVYNSLVLSVLLYGCKTWTILKSDKRKLEAFRMSC